MMFRVGQGFDVHAFEEGRPLIIGGITIPHEKGLVGHSDADVLLHTVISSPFKMQMIFLIRREYKDKLRFFAIITHYYCFIKLRICTN